MDPLVTPIMSNSSDSLKGIDMRESKMKIAQNCNDNMNDVLMNTRSECSNSSNDLQDTPLAPLAVRSEEPILASPTAPCLCRGRCPTCSCVRS